MTRNISYLSDFKEFDGGYDTFGEEPKKEKLLVKELLKLMCNKKNSVLFTDTRCFVLSPDFKLADESKVTLDESMLWHRRLGHVNSKTINKLVKENLVRGLPSKRFENDQTCVACLKGKQHKASFDKKVKIIKCDNGTEFKNKVMSEFYEQKGIKREYSIARTPQQNGAAERRNRILIEPAKTMVLVVKPHNKTPYELFRGRTPALSFMRPFGCHVTILNTLDYLAVLMKSDEGFFIRYSMNSKAFRVYNIRTRKVEENLHIRFLEDKPIIQLIGPKWLFWILIVLTKSINLVPVGCRSSQDYILMPMWKDGSLFDSSLKNASNDEPQPSSDAGKKDDEVTTALLEATHANFFGDETEIDMSNITATTGGTGEGEMTKTINEQGFISAVYEGKTHEGKWGGGGGKDNKDKSEQNQSKPTRNGKDKTKSEDGKTIKSRISLIQEMKTQNKSQRPKRKSKVQ
ncbi:ribonuclease H-like domain-containing protein [Tanacetum coccineum]